MARRRKNRRSFENKLEKPVTPRIRCNNDRDGKNLEAEEWLWEKDPFISNKVIDDNSSRTAFVNDWLNSWDKNLAAKDDDDDDDDCLLQEAIFLSSQLYYSRNTNIPGGCKDEPKTIDIKQKGIMISHPLEPYFGSIDVQGSEAEKGESSWSTCVICGDDKPTGALKQHKNCGHFFCGDCMRVYVEENIQENSTGGTIQDRIKCPEKKCNKFFSFKQLRQYIPEEVFDRILDSVCESEVLANPRFIKCPLLFCSAKFVDDRKGFKIKACPGCWRIFCVECRMKWHLGKSCQKFQAELRAQARAEAHNRALASLQSVVDFFK